MRDQSCVARSGLRPEAVAGVGVVPFGGGREEAAVPGDEVRLDRVQVQLEAEAGGVGDGDVAVLDDGFRNAVDEVAPGGDLVEVVLEGDEVLGGGGAVDA